MTKVTSYSVAKKTGLLSEGEVDFLKEIVMPLPVYPVAYIIGAGSGTSALALLEARNDILIYSIDNEFPTTHRYTPGEKKNLIDAGYWDSGRVIQVLGESQLIGKHWPYRCHMIFIDGDHRYKYIRDDILLWLPKVALGGVVAFHDYGTKEIKPKAGVKQAVDELIVNNKNVRCTEIGYKRFTKAFVLDDTVTEKDLDIYD